jgi:hypothetical protein
MKTQAELTFERPLISPQPSRHQRRLLRAQWWFHQMRQVVDRAWDRRASQAGRPEQIYFPLV